MRRLKSFLCVLSACALVMSLSGCGGDSSTQSGDEVVWIMAHRHRGHRPAQGFRAGGRKY